MVVLLCPSSSGAPPVSVTAPSREEEYGLDVFTAGELPPGLLGHPCLGAAGGLPSPGWNDKAVNQISILPTWNPVEHKLGFMMWFTLLHHTLREGFSFYFLQKARKVIYNSLGKKSPHCIIRSVCSSTYCDQALSRGF